MTDSPWLQLPDIWFTQRDFSFSLIRAFFFSFFLILVGRKRSWTRQWLKAFAVLLNRKWRLRVSTVVRKDSLGQLKEKLTEELQKRDRHTDSLCLNGYTGEYEFHTWHQRAVQLFFQLLNLLVSLHENICSLVLLERYQTVLKCFN